jgi:ParB family protein of integrating conjugative element (PFGI_1 class)
MNPTKKRAGFNPLTDGLPITISAEEALKNLATANERAARRNTPNTTALRAAEPEAGSPFSAVAGRTPTKAQREAAEFKASYTVGDTTPSRIDLRKDLPGPMLLKSTDIVRYDHNPRLYTNEKRDDIRQSLVANGFQGTLQVTRRRPADPFMLAAGSNTTLELLQEIYEKTGDERYLWVNCIYQPYQGETALLSQHLGENLNRGDMKFWEVAVAMVELLRLIEEERRQQGNSEPMPVREASEELTARGLKADKSSVGVWKFAVARLSPLGLAAAGLTRMAVRDVFQPRLNALAALATRFGVEETRYWNEVTVPVLRSVGCSVDAAAGMDASRICDAVEAALAGVTGETGDTIQQMLSILKLNPKVTLAGLRQPSPSLIAAGPAFCTGHDTRESDPENAAGPESAPTPSRQRPLNLTSEIPTAGGRAPDARAGSSPEHKQAPAISRTSPVTGMPRGCVGPLFDQNQGDAVDPLGALHCAVDELLATAGLGDTVRWHDAMPLGFYLELPDRETHQRQKVQIGSAEDQSRTIKTAVWWSLTTISGQWFEGVVDCIDHGSAFYKTYSVENHDSPLAGTDIEPLRPEVEELLLTRVSPGSIRHAMARLRVVEDLAAVVMEKLPERWKLMQQLVRSNSPY